MIFCHSFIDRSLEKNYRYMIRSICHYALLKFVNKPFWMTKSWMEKNIKLFWSSRSSHGLTSTNKQKIKLIGEINLYAVKDGDFTDHYNKVLAITYPNIVSLLVFTPSSCTTEDEKILKAQAK